MWGHVTLLVYLFEGEDEVDEFVVVVEEFWGFLGSIGVAPLEECVDGFLNCFGGYPALRGCGSSHWRCGR